jgi:threonine dehydrogenase-like Zn-dependent dehydrogenase
VIQVLAARGARTIIASEIEPHRKALTRHFGAHHVLDPSEGDIAEKCIAICGGHGVDVVFDAAGVQAGLDAAIKSCRVGASIVNIAAWKGRAEIDTLLMILGEKRYQAVFTYVRRDFEEVIEAVAAGESALPNLPVPPHLWFKNRRASCTNMEPR